jgi:hypothetical protein
MAHGNRNNSIKAFDVYFKNVSPEAYERPSFGYQATNEIVQNLVQKGFIERDTLEYIKLTQEGLDKCKEDCPLCHHLIVSLNFDHQSKNESELSASNSKNPLYLVPHECMYSPTSSISEGKLSLSWCHSLSAFSFSSLFIALNR